MLCRGSNIERESNKPVPGPILGLKSSQNILNSYDRENDVILEMISYQLTPVLFVFEFMTSWVVATISIDR